MTVKRMERLLWVLWALVGLEARASDKVHLVVQAHPDRPFVGQTVLIVVDIVAARLLLENQWLALDPVDEDPPPQLWLSWIRGNQWLQPLRAPEQLLQERLAKRGLGFRINQITVRNPGPSSPINDGFPADRFVLDRSEGELHAPDGPRPAYRYRLPLEFRARQAGTVEGIRAHFQAALFTEATASDGRVELQREYVSVYSEELRLTVRPLPLQNRPPYFTGAVGTFRLSASTSSASVGVGEPILLNLTIQGDGLLDEVGPPKLGSLPDWQKFRIYDEPVSISGNERERTFTYRIRPMSPDITRIPPVLWSFFDPERERYFTVATDPIPIQVRPVQLISLNELFPKNRFPEAPHSATVHVLHPNRPLKDLFATQGPWIRDFQQMAVFVLVPPVTWTVLLVVRYGLRRHVMNPTRWVRWKAKRQSRQLLRQAQGAPPREAALLIQKAVQQAVRWATGTPPGQVTPVEVATALQRAGVAQDQVDQCVQLLRACEEARFGKVSFTEQDKQQWVRTAQGMVATLLRLGSNRLPLAALVAVAFTLQGHGPQEWASRAQLQELFREAEQWWQAAVEGTGEVGQSAALFLKPASYYETAAALGHENGYLFYNLGNCYLLAGDLPHAHYWYLKANKYIPRDPWLRQHLQTVRERLNKSFLVAPPAASFVHAVALWATGVVSLAELEVIALGVWAASWSFLGLYAYYRRAFRLRISTFFLAVSLTALAAWWMCSLADASYRQAVVMKSGAILRTGPGLSYEAISPVEILPGAPCWVMATAGRWAEVVAPNGQRGWIQQSALEIVPSFFDREPRSGPGAFRRPKEPPSS